jgi:ABC-type dipeptide/oligopeptide/nickel transport system permease subunit
VTDIATGRLIARRRWPVSARLGAALLALLVMTALSAPWLAPYDPARQELSEDLRGPSREHPLGQDKLGRDQLSRIMFGARISLAVGLATVAIAVTIGVIVGAAGVSGHSARHRHERGARSQLAQRRHRPERHRLDRLRAPRARRSAGAQGA